MEVSKTSCLFRINIFHNHFLGVTSDYDAFFNFFFVLIVRILVFLVFFLAIRFFSL